jgi:hypothetical protein
VGGIEGFTLSPTITRVDGPRLLADVAVFGPAAAAVSQVSTTSDVATTSDVTTPGLLLVDATGAPLSIALDENTLVIGAATWCSACAQFKAQLAAAHSAGQLAGLRVVFAFGNEGGAGPQGVLRPEFLSGLPGEVAFLAPGSVTPERYPSAFNPQSGQFDTHAAEAVGDWLRVNTSSQAIASSSSNTDTDSTSGATASSSSSALSSPALLGKPAVAPTPGIEAASSDASSAGPSCGCGSKAGASGKNNTAATPLAAALALQPAPELAGPAPQSLSTTPGGSTFEVDANGDLVWTGTAGVDEVVFTQLDATTIRAALTLDNGAASSFVEDFSGVTGAVKGFGLAGNDKIDASLLTTTAALLDGGAGNNRLCGGQANDILSGGSNGGEGQQGSHTIVGGAGNDTIFGNAQAGAEGSTGGNHLLNGGSGNDTIYGAYQTVYKSDHVTLSNGGEGGRNLIVGGEGEDTIYASQTSDGAEGGKGSILVAGTTLLDEAALTLVLSEWTSARTYAERIANISGPGSPTRLNGDNFLQPGVTVASDNVSDQLFGDSQGQLHWFLHSSTGDTASRVKVGETETDTPDSQLPGAFGITGPLTPVLMNDDIVIDWQASPGATSYQIVVSRNADLSDPFFDEVTIANQQPLNDLGEGDIYVGLWAVNAAGTTQSFNTPYHIEISFEDFRQTLFVTDTEYYVDFFESIPPPTEYFGSSNAADYQCTRLAYLAGFLDEDWDQNSILYKALLTNSFIDIESRSSIGDNGFINVLGEQIAADRDQLYAGEFTAPILTQTGVELVGHVPVWTGANPDGTWSGWTANDWVDPFSTATVGNLNGAGSQWLSNGTQWAEFSARLYCISVD